MTVPHAGADLAAVDYDPFADAPLARVVPTTEPQREIWLACQLGEQASLAYNESVSLRLRGPLDRSALHSAVHDLVDRHEALRATISPDGQSLYLADALAIALPLTDLAGLSPDAQDLARAKTAQRAVETPFDLEHGPLVRVELLAFGAEDHLLVITAHHIVCDGWSFGVLVTELPTLYARRLGRPGAGLPAADSFANYAIAQLDDERSRTREADTAYWVSLYDRSVPVLDLPTDRPRKAVRSFVSRREEMAIDVSLVTAVRKLGAAQGASLFVTLFGTFSALIARLGGTRDVVVGVSAAGQAVEGASSLVGHCVNLLPIRVAVDIEQSATALVRHANSCVLDAYDHQQCTYGSLLKKLQVQRDPGRLPLVSVLFNLDSSIDTEALSVGDLHVELTSNARHFENFDLYLNVSQVAGGLVLECQYHTDLFDAVTVRRWLTLYRVALERACADPEAPLALTLAPTPEDTTSLESFNRTEHAYPGALRLGDLILQGMRSHADGIAVVFEGRQVSFRELEGLAWGVAARLRAQGVGPGVLVGVCLERSVEMVAALVGVVFSGAAYVPLDPTLPADRLARMVEDAGLRRVLTRSAERDTVGHAFCDGCELMLLDRIESAAAGTVAGEVGDPAYVIFTSGSTGRPKGAANAHRGIVNRLLWMQQAYALGRDDRVLQKTPFTFDVSVWEFFWPLSTGTTLVVARPDGHRDGEYLIDLIRREQVTVMHFVPSMLRLFLAQPGAAHCRDLRRVLCSGEALPYDLVERFFECLPDVALANLYGPTEAAVDVTAWECRPNDASGMVPIGAPIANTAMHVLDERLRPLPLGVPGDLYIGGVQVGLGYVGRPELTAERFIASPLPGGERLYKTGDVARWRADGALVYLGRSDFQVKLRGYRIELGEIEAELLAHPEVDHAVAVTREDEPGDIRLVAYVVSRNTTLDTAGLRDVLRATLPDYMIPQQVMRLDALPLLSSGKVDRKALPRPATGAAPIDRPRIAARNAVEQQVLSAMESVLNLPDLSVQDDFFALGGHSLLAAKLTARLNKELGVKLTLSTIFQFPTAEGLARRVPDLSTGADASRPVIMHADGVHEGPLTVMQERIRFMEDLYPGRVVYNTPSAHRLTGALDVEAFEEALRRMVQRQPSLRTFIAATATGHVQRVVEQLDVSLPFEDLSTVTDADRDAALMQRLQRVIDQPIDIHSAPLFRVALYRLAPEEHVFLFMPHHIVWDGWSFDLLYQEMSALYPAALNRRPAELPAPTVTYLDYARWHAHWMASDECSAQIEFWKSRYAGIDTMVALPTDRPRHAGMTGVGAVEWIHADKAFTEQLRQIARQCDATLNMLIMAVYALMIGQALGSRSLVLGIPVRGRLISEVEPVMGFFNNLLPMPLNFDVDQPLRAWIGNVKRELLDAFAHQEVPFERLSSEPEIARLGGKAGLYQSLFSFQDARERIRTWGPLQHQSVLVMQKGATEDFGLWLMEVPGGLEGGINYNADLFDAATAQAFRERLIGLLQRVSAAPDLSLSALLAMPGDDSDRFGAWVRSRTADAAATPSRAPAPVAELADASDRTGSEERLAAIWARLLGIDASQIAPDDNFFDIGGNSLLVMQAIAAGERDGGSRIDPRRYVYESLRQLSIAAPSAPPAVAEAAADAQTSEPTGLLSRVFGRFGRRS